MQIDSGENDSILFKVERDREINGEGWTVGGPRGSNIFPTVKQKRPSFNCSKIPAVKNLLQYQDSLHKKKIQVVF